MWRIKQRRTKPRENKEKTGVVYPKFSSTSIGTQYINKNTYLDIKGTCALGGCQCSIDVSGNTYCCKTTYRNPILGYRKYLVLPNNDISGVYMTNVTGNVYKDNYADCSRNSARYNPVIRRKQNRNGFVNESYNYSTNQLLTRRCLTFPQQEFNFQSQVPVGDNTKFKSCANCQYKTTGCDCSANGFCLAVNKLPCEVKNTKCYAVYKRNNKKFNRQGAVSGGSRINRLKYQTKLVSQSRRVNGRNNVINRVEPAALYTTSRPLTIDASGCRA